MRKRQSFQDLHNTIYLNNTISKLATKRVIVIKSNPRTKSETSWDKRKLTVSFFTKRLARPDGQVKSGS